MVVEKVAARGKVKLSCACYVPHTFRRNETETSLFGTSSEIEKNALPLQRVPESRQLTISRQHSGNGLRKQSQPFEGDQLRPRSESME